MPLPHSEVDTQSPSANVYTTMWCVVRDVENTGLQLVQGEGRGEEEGKNMKIQKFWRGLY